MPAMRSGVQQPRNRSPRAGRILRTAVLATALASAGIAIPATAQSTNAAGETPAEEYARILQQIDDTRIDIARREALIASQERQIASLRSQISDLPTITAALPAVLSRFSAQLESTLESDPPFLLAERYERLNRMQELLGDEEAKLAEKVARALQVATIETNYGFEVASYEGEHPLDPRRRYKACEEDLESRACAITDELRDDLAGGASLPQLDTQILDGDYVRYGRLSLAYVDKGSDDVLVYTSVANEDGQNWRGARGSEVSDIRRNLRIARGEAAPDMVEAPVVKN